MSDKPAPKTLSVDLICYKGQGENGETLYFVQTPEMHIGVDSELRATALARELAEVINKHKLETK